MPRSSSCSPSASRDPRTDRDWRSFGAFSAFIVALFAEMYGFPLTIYLLSGWLGSRYPALDPFSHDAGHLWSTLLGLQGNPHFGVLHLLSNLLIFGGFVLIAAGMGPAAPGAAGRNPRHDGPVRAWSATPSTWASSRSWSASCCSGRPC